MKAAVALLFVLACSVLAESSVRTQFASYVRQYNKRYSSREETERRFQNFEASLNRTAALNASAKKAKFGINKFSDMSVEEFKSVVLMKNPIIPSRVPEVETLKPKTTGALPTSFDWRTKGAVTPVKDQGQCGSCWAFSVTENIESMWILSGKASNSTLNLGPQQIVDCDEYDAGCEGGNPPTAYDYIISAPGLEPAVDYPYTAQDGTCNFQAQDVQVKISNWQYATDFYSETTLQNNLVSWGPLSICVDAANWQDYASGVLTWEECAWINELDHCVQLVGYQTQTPLGDYWLVRNSWGLDWGVNGYIWLEMGYDTCGLTHEATSSIV